MTDVEVVEVTSQIELFLQKRCPGGESLKVTGYEPITGGYSRAMARVWVEDSDGRRGYIVRADPPPGQAIIETDRTEEWELLTALSEAGTIPLAGFFAAGELGPVGGQNFIHGFTASIVLFED